MRKTFFVLLALFFIFFACDNDDMNNGKEENPYPDGVYPFEVTNVSHTQTSGENGQDFKYTWDVPNDSGFVKVQLDYYLVSTGQITDEGAVPEHLMYSSSTGFKSPEFQHPQFYGDIKLEKNFFSFWTNMGSNGYLIIKCVDKFGNISEGVRYEFEYIFQN